MNAATRWELQSMLDELESSRLEVILVPERRRTHDCGMIRCAISKNARWYRAFCGENLSSRVRRNLAPDTAIKRAQTLRSLRRLLAGSRPRGRYAWQLVEIAARRAQAAAKRDSARVLQPSNPF